MTDLPALQFEPGPCVRCGARTEAQAASLCRSDTDETGEHDCPGEFDEAGVSIRPTAASLAALDAAIDALELP